MSSVVVRGKIRVGGISGAGQVAVLICGCSVSGSTGRQGVRKPSIVCVAGMGKSVKVIRVAVVCGGGVGMCCVLFSYGRSTCPISVSTLRDKLLVWLVVARSWPARSR